MPKEPYNKGDAVLRTDVLHAKRLIAEEIMFQGPDSGKIFTSGGADLRIQPEGDGQVFIRGQQIGGGAPATIQIQKDGGLVGFADVLHFKESGVDVSIVAEVASLLFAQKTDTTIEVSADYTASDVFQQSPTIAAALVRSAYLKGLGKSATIMIQPGFYAEDLHNLNDENIIFMPGAYLVGSSTPNVPLVSVSGGIVVLNDLWSYTSLGVHKTDLLRVNSGNCFCNRGFLGFPQLDDADHALYVVDNAGLLAVSAYLGWCDQETVVIEGTATPYRHMFNTTLDSFNKTPLKLLNGSLGSLNNTLWMMNCSLSSIENILLSAESYNRFYLYSTLVEISRMSLGAGFAQIGYWHSAKAINQNTYPEPGASIGTIQYALDKVDEWQTLNEPAIKKNSMNIATILAESEFQGPFDGVVVETYGDETGIDAGNSYNYKVRPNSVLELGDFHDIDNFESYADTAALQAAWVANGSFWDCSLNTIDAIEGAQCMEILIGASPTPANDWLRYTYGSTQDQHGVCCARGFTRGIVGTAFRIRAVDSGGNFNTSPIIYPGPEWTYFSVSLTPDPSFDPTDVTDVDIVYAGGSSGQTLLLDELYFVGTDVFTNDALIDEMDAVVADWTVVGTGLTISQNTTDMYSGTGSMQVIVGPGATTDLIVRDDFGAGQDFGEDTALNIWVKVTAVTTAGILKLQPRIYNTTNRIDLPSILIDSSRLGDGWYPIPIPFTRFDVGAGTVFNQNNVTKVEFYVPESSVFRGTFLLDLFQRGYAAQAQSVDANKTFWPGSPSGGQAGLAIVEQHGAFEDIDLDCPALADVSMVVVNPWKFDQLSADPPYQLFGRSSAELKTWIDMKQAAAFFETRMLAFGISNISGWTWTWR